MEKVEQVTLIPQYGSRIPATKSQREHPKLQSSNISMVQRDVTIQQHVAQCKCLCMDPIWQFLERFHQFNGRTCAEFEHHGYYNILYMYSPEN